MIELLIFFLIGGIVFIIIFIILSRQIEKISNLFKKKDKIKRPHSFICLDGDKVRSKGELIIDNYLTKLGINHIYEKTIHVRGKPIKYDWFLPDSEVYIEYFGYFGKEYEKRKEEKLYLYKKGKLNLISIEDIMFTNIYPVLDAELKKYMKTEKKSKGKHCPNCGEFLDDRF